MVVAAEELFAEKVVEDALCAGRGIPTERRVAQGGLPVTHRRR